MNKTQLCNTSKKLLRALYNNEDWEELPGITQAQLVGAAKQLTDLELVKSVINYGELYAIDIEPLGIAYIEEYPDLDDPVSVDIEKLTKQNLTLQNDALEYQAKIRKQEGRIRLWQFITAILAVVVALLSFFKD